jgi:hypothetical protein
MHHWVSSFYIEGQKLSIQLWQENLLTKACLLLVSIFPMVIMLSIMAKWKEFNRLWNKDQDHMYLCFLTQKGHRLEQVY